MEPAVNGGFCYLYIICSDVVYHNNYQATSKAGSQ